MKNPPAVVSLDIETRSGADLKKVGVYKYVEDPDFDVLLVAYAFDDGPVHCADLTREPFPQALAQALASEETVKKAYNAAFERVCLSRFLGTQFSPDTWRCTMVGAAADGLGGSLAGVSKALGLAEKKDTRGTRLITKFCKPTREGGFNSPEDHPEDWQDFIEYCLQDVAVERAIAASVAQLPDDEQRLYSLDQRINDRGIPINSELAAGAVACLAAFSDAGKARMREVTGLENPGSVQQLAAWLAEKRHPVASVNKEAVQGLLALPDLSPEVREVLELRTALALSSVKKFIVARDAVCSDGRLRGTMQFFGAHTGRWAGRLLQVQNLPQPKPPFADPESGEPTSLVPTARRLTCAADVEALEMLFDDVPDVLKNLIRTVIEPAAGGALIVSDFSAIEARVLAWLAGEQDTLNAFREGLDIYKVTASKMYGCPYEAVDKEQRGRGKVAVLACGYQGALGAMSKMGGPKIGMTDEDMLATVRAWRAANPRIVKLWYALEKAWRLAATDGGSYRVGRLRVLRRGSSVKIVLPSGRELTYRAPRVSPDGKLSFLGKGPNVGFVRVDTYGGKLVENVTQAAARDLMAGAMTALDAAGIDLIMTVHDEVVAECETSHNSAETLALVDTMSNIMTTNPVWADGLPLAAETAALPHYWK